jgi:hypothetical protein
MATKPISLRVARNVKLDNAALAYAQSFPDEVEADRAAGRPPLEELDMLVP